MTEEAKLERTSAGLVPGGEGWFVVNARDTAWMNYETLGASCRFESPDRRFAEYGINLHVLVPGQASARYHRESSQEDFLVLAGECLLVIEGEERLLRAWDFVHCPAETAHVFVGAGEAPCVILMVGTRKPDGTVFYPDSELARRHGAGVEVETDSPFEAYQGLPKPSTEHPDCWEELPWA
jgi:uncharacterized cupin superfamily protein